MRNVYTIHRYYKDDVGVGKRPSSLSTLPWAVRRWYFPCTYRLPSVKLKLSVLKTKFSIKKYVPNVISITRLPLHYICLFIYVRQVKLQCINQLRYKIRRGNFQILSLIKTNSNLYYIKNLGIPCFLLSHEEGKLRRSYSIYRLDYIVYITQVTLQCKRGKFREFLLNFFQMITITKCV